MAAARLKPSSSSPSAESSSGQTGSAKTRASGFSATPLKNSHSAPGTISAAPNPMVATISDNGCVTGRRGISAE